MERKTAVVTSEEVAVALNKVRTLTSEEEKALRMRHGVGAGHAEPLPRAAGRNAELDDELLVIEMQLMRAWRARMAAAQATSTSARPAQNKSKDKIVRALRKKK